MDLFKKHVRTFIILSAFGAAVFWMDGKFNQIQSHLNFILYELGKISEWAKQVNE